MTNAAISRFTMFKAPFSFSGRISRTEYFVSGLLSLFIYAIGIGIMAAAGDAAVLGVIIILPVAWFALAQGWKRSHDAGWHGIISIIPYVNFVLLFASGDKDTNEYGPNPRFPAAHPGPPPHPRPMVAPTLPSGWVNARRDPEPIVRTSSFKCGSCGAQNVNVAHNGTACCQFCGVPKA